MESLRDSDPRDVAGYRLVKRIASGGMGIVYLGVSPGGRDVAVKLMRPDLTGDPECLARFRREVEANQKVGGRARPGPGRGNGDRLPVPPPNRARAHCAR